MVMAQFRPFEMDGIPIEEQFMNWKEIVKAPYDRKSVDAYTRTRVILMNGIEDASVLMSHAMERMTVDPEIKRQMALIRRIDSFQQQTVDWLNPANQTVIETTLGYEQVAVDLTANLAKNESDPYVKQTLDFALLEDFDHLYRYSCLYNYLEGGDYDTVVQGKTEVKPARPTSVEHRHPDDTMREHYDKDTADIKTKMNCITIVAGEQQTELFYKTHGNMYTDELARQLYSEIADVEEQLDITPQNMEYMRFKEIADDWSSFKFQWKMNKAGVPSEEVVGKARSDLAKRDQARNIKDFKNQVARRTEDLMAGRPAPPM